MQKPIKPYLFFDLDGTLSDPAQGICGSIRYALEKGGYTPEPLEAYHPWIGPPLLKSFTDYLNVSDDEGKRLLSFYRERFSVIGLYENTLYAGMKELIRDLYRAGARMVVATGKPTVYAERIIDYFGLTPYFELISGIPLSEAPLGKDGVIDIGMKWLGVQDARECLMVGDRHHDVEGARANGMPCAYVLYGYGSEREAREAGAAYCVESVDALRTLLLP